MYGRDSDDGIITIYLGLILSIIVAFILTTIECARMSTAKIIFHETLQTSMESSLCDYYLPLFEQYHLFGLDTLDQTLEQQKEKLKGMVQERMDDSIYPEEKMDIVQSLWNLSDQNFLMAYPDITELKIDDCIFLTDERGAYAKDQMIAYMKYQAPANLIEHCLNAVGAMEENKGAADLLKEKVRINAKMGEVDEHALHIMELVEGLTYKRGKKLKSKHLFAKRIIRGEPTMERVLVRSTEVFDVLEDSYEDYFTRIDEIVDNIDELVRIEELLQGEGQDDVRLGKQLKKEKSELLEVNRRMEGQFNNAIEKIQQCIQEAIEEIDALNQERNLLKEDYEGYRKKISELGDKMSEGLIQELSSQDPETNAYEDSSEANISVILDIEKMKETLQFNEQLLNQMIQLRRDSYDLEVEEKKEYYSTVKSLLFQYRIEGLEFDYEDMNLTEESGGLFDMIMDWIGNSMGEMVSKDLEISECCISNDALPSKNLTISENYDEEITVEDARSGGTSYFGDAQLKEVTMDEKSMISPMVDSLLLSAYTTDHMTNFLSKSYRRGQVLAYEQEYIIVGRKEDRDNFNSITWRLLGLRLPGNICSVMIDSEKQQWAEATAITAVGWIPLAGLVQIVKYIILIYWAYCESVMEVSALIHGKEVPVYTTKADFAIQYNDIFHFSAELIAQRVSSYKSKDRMKLGYEEYLWIMMMFVPDEEIVLRCCDVIQENLRYEYDESFKISDCIISYHVEATGFLKQKFLLLPLFQREKKGMDGYEVTGRTSVTY